MAQCDAAPELRMGCCERAIYCKNTNAGVGVGHCGPMEDGNPSEPVKGPGQGLRISNVLLQFILLKIWG